MKRKSKHEIIMTDDRLKQERLFRYLLWAMSTIPAKFRMLSEFQAWAQPLGFNESECRICWESLRSIYRPLYGAPVYVEAKQVA